MPAKRKSPHGFDVATLEKLLQVGQSLVTVQDLKPLLLRIAKTAGSVLEADVVVLYEYHEETGDVTIPPIIWGDIRHPEVLEARGQARAHKNSAVFRVLGRAKPVYAPDATKDWPQLIKTKPAVQGKPKAFVDREGIVSSAAVRLTAGKEKVGALFVNYRTRQDFDDKEQKIIELFAVQAAIAIQNARLLAKERTLLEQAVTLRKVSGAISFALELGEISSALISAPELRRVAEGVLDELAKVVEYRKASLQLIRGDVREMVTFRGPGEPNAASWLLPQISQDALIKRVVECKEPLVLSRTRDDRDWTVHDETFDVNSWVGIPLVYGQETVGLITLDHDQPGYYTDATKDQLAPFCRQAAMAIYNAYLLVDLQRQVRGHQALNTVGTELAGILNEEAILTKVARAAANAIDCTHCTVFRLENKELVVRGAEGNRGWSLSIGRTFEQGQGVAGWVAQTGQPVIVPNTRNDDRFSPGWSAPQSDPLSLVEGPIWLDGQVYGVISVEHDRVGAFDEQDQQLVMTLASQVSQAVRNARLRADLEQQIERLQTLNQISHELGAKLDAEPIYKAVARAVVQTLDCTHCTIFGLEHNSLVPRASLGKGTGPLVTRRFALGEGVAGWVAQEGQAILIRDAKKHERFVTGKTRPQVDRSIIVAPIKTGDRVVGVISADQDRVNAFDERDLQMVETLALQASTALQNAHLFEETQHRVRDLEIVHRVTQVINSELNPQNLFRTIASQIARQLKCTHCTLFFPKEKNGLLVLAPVETFGERPEIMGRTFRLDEGLVGWVFQHGESLVLPDVRQDPRFSPARDIKERPRSMLVAPVKVGVKTLGVISADQDEFGWFSENDRRLVDALAQQAGIAIQRAEGLRLLQDIGNQVISAPNQAEILQRIVSGAIKLIHAKLGVIYLFSDDKQLITKQYHYPPDFNLPIPRLDKGHGLTHQLITNPEIIAIPDIEQDLRVNRELVKLGVRSLIGIPLMLEQKVIGALYLNDSERHDFTETEQSLLSTLASQAAIAIENARLFNSEQAKAQQLLRLHQVLDITMRTLDFEQVLPLLVKNVVETFEQGTSAAIDLYDPDKREFIPPTFAVGPKAAVLKDNPPREQGVSATVVQSKQALFVHDAASAQLTRPEFAEQGLKSFACLPLFVGDVVLGTLYICFELPHLFPDDERRVLELFASEAAVVLQNAKIYEQRSKDLAALQKIVGAIGFGSDPLPIILEETIKLFRAEYGAFALVNPDAKQLTFQAIWEKTKMLVKDQIPEGQRHRSWEIGITGYVAQKGLAHYTGNVGADPHYKKWHESTVSELAVPLRGGDGKVIGVLDLESSTPNAFHEAQVTLCQNLANVAATALEKDQILDTMQQMSLQMEGLHQVTQGESTADVLDRILNSINIILGKETSSCMALYEQANNSFYDYQTAGPLKDYLSTAYPRPTGGTSQHALQTKQPYYLPDVLHPEPGCPTINQKSIDRGVRSFAALPLKWQGQIVGMLFINLEKTISFPGEIKRILDLFANQAAIAIENAQLVHQLERRVLELDALSELSARVLPDVM